MKRITLEELEKKYGTGDYEVLYLHIIRQIETGKLTPVKASKTNGNGSFC